MNRLKEVAVLTAGFSIAIFAVIGSIGLWGGAIVWAGSISPWLALAAIVVPVGAILALIITSEDLNDPM